MNKKGTDKQYVAVFCYTLQLIVFVPNFKILSQVVAEKSLTDKKVYKQTNIVTEKAKTIYPLYTSYRGYNDYSKANRCLKIWKLMHRVLFMGHRQKLFR